MIDKITLSNGVRLVCEPMDSVRSAAVGLWMGCGSRYETEKQGGISHAIEHMLFKGTRRRSAAQIAEEMDAIGGQVNAFTTKELTSFYARSLDSHLDAAIDLLCDIFFNPRFNEDDWTTERGVIIEEIGMYEDSPEDLVGEELYQAIYSGSSLGRPILGRADTLDAINASDMLAYKNENYRSGRLVVSLAGHYSDKDISTLTNVLSALPAAQKTPVPPAAYKRAFTKKQKPIEQNHLSLGFPSLPAGHSKRYTLQILSGILGAGMSSRLFQRVREQNGLCYSVYSFTAAHLDNGVFGVYTALGRETEEKALRLIREVIGEFAENGPTSQELDRVREQIKSNVLMGMESTSSRMHHLGQSELISGEIAAPDQIIERYDAVTAQGIRELAAEIFNFDNLSFSAVGNVENTDYESILMGG